METDQFETKQEANFAYLKDQLKYLGFADSLEQPLRAAMAENGHDFTLRQEGPAKGHDGSAAIYGLQFSKGSTQDRYYLNSYILQLVHPEEGLLAGQLFPVNHTHGITAKEALNLMEGRAVYKRNLTNKEGEKYNSWVQLNLSEKDEIGNSKFKMFHDNYGFDLEKKLEALPVRERGDVTAKERLVKGLQRGNLQPVTWQENGQEEKRYLAANPQFKGIDQYYENFKKVFVENKKAAAPATQAETVQPDPLPEKKGRGRGR